jgi:Uma2 family endonuclease
LTESNERAKIKSGFLTAGLESLTTMAVQFAANPPDIDYPSSDGRPMAETDDHRENMVDLIETLKRHFESSEPPVYVSGNLLVFYEAGNRHRHLSPDVFVVRGVPNRLRDNYLIWEEGKGPEVVIELTSRSTKGEDVDDKFWLYRDRLKVPEYFLFDPHQEYLNPPLQGYRLIAKEYVPIERVEGRLPSEVLGLHLEQNGREVRLFDPNTGQRLPTAQEALALTTAALDQAEAGRRQEENARRLADAARKKAEEEAASLRAELERLRGKS